MDFTYATYPEWFRTLPAESQERLADNDLDWPSIEQRVAALREKGWSEDKIKEEKISILYRAFYHTSDESTQQTLREAGIVDLPNRRFNAGDNDHVESNRSESDMAESNLSRCEAASIIESETKKLEEQFGLTESDAEILEEMIEEKVSKLVERRVSNQLQAVVATFLEAPNAKIAAGGLAFAANLAALNGLKSQAAYGRKIGVTRAAISKSVRHWKEVLDLPTNSHMKSDDACENYRQSANEDHWRNRKWKSDEESDDTDDTRDQSDPGRD
jgi:hypothetical protein